MPPRRLPSRRAPDTSRHREHPATGGPSPTTAPWPLPFVLGRGPSPLRPAPPSRPKPPVLRRSISRRPSELSPSSASLPAASTLGVRPSPSGGSDMAARSLVDPTPAGGRAVSGHHLTAAPRPLIWAASVPPDRRSGPGVIPSSAGAGPRHTPPAPRPNTLKRHQTSNPGFCQKCQLFARRRWAGTGQIGPETGRGPRFAFFDPVLRPPAGPRTGHKSRS